jgi:hypothetical protein
VLLLCVRWEASVIGALGGNGSGLKLIAESMHTCGRAPAGAATEQITIVAYIRMVGVTLELNAAGSMPSSTSHSRIEPFCHNCKKAPFSETASRARAVWQPLTSGSVLHDRTGPETICPNRPILMLSPTELMLCEITPTE